jgi:predicted nucleic acid-binding protein
MPLIYADTSALFAYLHPRDVFSALVDAAVQKESPDFVYWPFLRYELRHNIRLARIDTDGEVAWQALRVAEKTSARLRWQGELTADKMLDAAEELSAERALEMKCGGGDVLHVAAARRTSLISGLDEFWTCDADQAELARIVGLKTRLFELKKPTRRVSN